MRQKYRIPQNVVEEKTLLRSRSSVYELYTLIPPRPSLVSCRLHSHISAHLDTLFIWPVVYHLHFNAVMVVASSSIRTYASSDPMQLLYTRKPKRLIIQRHKVLPTLARAGGLSVRLRDCWGLISCPKSTKDCASGVP